VSQHIFCLYHFSRLSLSSWVASFVFPPYNSMGNCSSECLSDDNHDGQGVQEGQAVARRTTVFGESFSMEALGIHMPTIPGDIALAGTLTKSRVSSIAFRYASWICLTDDAFSPHEAALNDAGIEVAVLAFPSFPTLPSQEQAAALLSAMETMPRPLMLQASTVLRAGIALLLHLAKSRTVPPELAAQFGEDVNHRFFADCILASPMQQWILSNLPKEDILRIRKPIDGLVMRQLFDPDTSTFTYLLGCLKTREAILIDPVLEQKDRDLGILRDWGFRLLFGLNTHCHADHITGTGAIKKELPHVKSIISVRAGAKCDIPVDDGDTIVFGAFDLHCIATPGHTNGCVTFHLRERDGKPGMLFTGDALLIRGCGRTDFQHGDPGLLYDGLWNKLFALPDKTLVYPGHDYKGRFSSTVGEEKKFNHRLTKPRAEFIELMNNLNLPYPKKIDVAVPANVVCGIQE